MNTVKTVSFDVFILIQLDIFLINVRTFDKHQKKKKKQYIILIMSSSKKKRGS